MQRALAVLIVASVCGVMPAAGASAGSGTARYEPKFETTACDDVVPADPRVECGLLTVPVDRSHPDRGDVTMPVAIIKSADPNPLPDPIVFFSGGPGGPGRDNAQAFLNIDLGGRRDVILFDQRGTGQSTPSLDCAQQTDAVWQTLAAPTSPRVEAEVFRDVLAECRTRLVADGVDLDAYDTSTTTDDVADLRRVLAIDRWNLYGGSYGTTVVLEMLRRHPEDVRSAVLDSVYPTDEPMDAAEDLRVAKRALKKLFAGCASDPTCSAAYPAFEKDFDALVDDWNTQPFETSVMDPATGQPRSLVLTGDDVVAAVWNAMYDETFLPLIPSLIAPLRERGEAANTVVGLIATEGIDALAGSAEGVVAAVDCADRQRLSRSDPDTTIVRNPRFAGLLALSTTGNACDVIEVKSVPASFNKPVRSDLPALIYADEYDPTTPPANGRLAARTLTSSTVVSTHGLGHTVATVNDCTRGIFDAFLADPKAPVDTSCAAEMQGPAWAA